MAIKGKSGLTKEKLEALRSDFVTKEQKFRLGITDAELKQRGFTSFPQLNMWTK